MANKTELLRAPKRLKQAKSTASPIKIPTNPETRIMGVSDQSNPIQLPRNNTMMLKSANAMVSLYLLNAKLPKCRTDEVAIMEPIAQSTAVKSAAISWL